MPKNRSSSPSANYEIGYRRPPKRYQFKRGSIANPAGINQHTAPVNCSGHEASVGA